MRALLFLFFLLPAVTASARPILTPKLEVSFIEQHTIEIELPAALRFPNQLNVHRFRLLSTEEGNRPVKLPIASVVYSLDSRIIEVRLKDDVPNCDHSFRYVLKIPRMQLKGMRPAHGSLSVPVACWDSF